ncbi:MAG TPA: hypothetical protein VEN81_16065, partial [Planctomycetota bacterium]|nr:hypothetical protein [Planctomycetota bacterium]
MDPLPEDQIQNLLRQSKWAVRSKMEENEKEFHLAGFTRFDWDPWRGELVFSSAGTPKVVARIQVVGTLSTKGGTWLWAWAIPSLLEPVRRSVLRVKEFGADNGVLRLIEPRWAAKEADAWEMTGLALRLSEAVGAFRAPGPDSSTFMIFTDIQAVSHRKRVFGARTCSHVLEADRAILLVSRESDGEVLAVCGGEDDTEAT